MISRIKVTNYRCFQKLDFRPNPSVNIVVGDNEAGKTTLLEVISLAIGGRVRGRWAAEDLSPYWFNQAAVKQYFVNRRNGENPELPVIDLEIYFSENTSGAERLRGIHNSEGVDCPGLRMQVLPDADHQDELNAYLGERDLPELIPTDLFTVKWRDFSGETVSRQPRKLGFALVNNNFATNQSGVDFKLRQLVRDFVSPKESAQIALAHRRAKAGITSGVLQDVNRRIEVDDKSFGVSLQMDHSANANWDASVAPHIGLTPFSMLGQGRQVETKIALAMSRSADHTQFVLVEEPENHLSHTQMLKVLNHINTLSGDRQLFVTTHSTFVLNRLGFNAIHLMHKANLVPLDTNMITRDTIEYFQKQSGYDTLRLAIAGRVVVVEGPSDEMVFNLAYSKIKGAEPRDHGVDVIALGTRGKRALELARALNKKIAVLRDNDGKDPSHWRGQAGSLLEPNKREMFIGDPSLGDTLEPQLVRAGSGNDALLRQAIPAVGPSESLEAYMLSAKTEWAWRVAEAAPALVWPQYFRDAIEFIYGN